MLRHDQLAVLEIRSEDAVIPSEVGTWSGYQRSQPCDERQQVHHDMRCSVAEGVVELVYDLSMIIDRESLVGQRRSGDVAPEAFELAAFVFLVSTDMYPDGNCADFDQIA